MRKFFILASLILTVNAAIAQDEMTNEERLTNRVDLLESAVGKLSNLKISGYLQAQWQWAEQPGIDAFQDGGKFNPDSRNRFMVRRGRIKFAYTYKNIQLVVQPDFSEKGVSLKDAYLNLSTNDKVAALQMGVFDRPFGYEISYSSSLRESAERSRVFLSLFPGERGVGAMAILKGKSGELANFTLNAGLFNGNGVGAETDSRKDFIGRIAYLKKMSNLAVGASFSTYLGGVRNVTANDRTEQFNFVSGTGFEAKEVDKNSYIGRNYYGVGATFLLNSCIGVTNIRAEYLFGQQPGTLTANADPSGTSFGAGTAPLYVRNFSGYYAILVQDIGKSRHSVTLKYDAYDPNTKIKGDEIGKLAGTGVADIAYGTFGFGYLFRLNANLRLMAYYDMPTNERSANMKSTNPLKNFSSRIKQNVFTLRAQVKF